MILNTKVTIAYKNDLGFYNVKNVNVFRLGNEDPFASFKLSIYRRKEFLIRAKCPLCGEYHNYRFNIYSLLTKGIAIGGCDIVGEPIVIIGKERNVIDLIDKYKEVNIRIDALI